EDRIEILSEIASREMNARKIGPSGTLAANDDGVWAKRLTAGVAAGKGGSWVRRWRSVRRSTQRAREGTTWQTKRPLPRHRPLRRTHPAPPVGWTWRSRTLKPRHASTTR